MQFLALSWTITVRLYARRTLEVNALKSCHQPIGYYMFVLQINFCFGKIFFCGRWCGLMVVFVKWNNEMNKKICGPPLKMQQILQLSSDLEFLVGEMHLR